MAHREQSDPDFGERSGGERAGIFAQVGRPWFECRGGLPVEFAMAGAEPAALDEGFQAVGADLAQGHLEIGIGGAGAQPKIDAAGAGDDDVVRQRRGGVGEGGAVGQRCPVVGGDHVPRVVGRAVRKTPRRAQAGIGSVCICRPVWRAGPCARQRSVRPEIPGGGPVGGRPFAEAQLEAGGGQAGRGGAGAVFHQHAHVRIGFEQPLRAGEIRDAGEAIDRHRWRRGAALQNRAVDDRGDRRQTAGRGHAMRDVEIEEGRPVPQTLRFERGGVDAVGDGDLDVAALRHSAQHLREPRAGLLVLPRAGQEHRHLNLVHPVDRRTVVHLRRRVVGQGSRRGDRVVGLQSQSLVGATDFVAVIDALPGPALAALRRGGRVVLPVLQPTLRKAVVEDPAGKAGRLVDVGDHRQRRERGQVRRL